MLMDFQAPTFDGKSCPQQKAAQTYGQAVDKPENDVITKKAEKDIGPRSGSPRPILGANARFRAHKSMALGRRYNYIAHITSSVAIRHASR